jgi:hypothetical protein
MGVAGGGLGGVVCRLGQQCQSGSNVGIKMYTLNRRIRFFPPLNKKEESNNNKKRNKNEKMNKKKKQKKRKEKKDKKKKEKNNKKKILIINHQIMDFLKFQIISIYKS